MEAIIKIDSDELKVLNFDYELYQETNVEGRPSSVVRGGKITFTIESTNSTMLSEWMMDNSEQKSGDLVLIDPTGKELKQVKFKDAFAISYKETFENVGKKTANETITISSREMEIGSGSLENKWPKS